MTLADFEAMAASGNCRGAGLCGDIAPPSPLGGARYVCTRTHGHPSQVHEARSSSGQLYAQWSTSARHLTGGAA